MVGAEVGAEVGKVFGVEVGAGGVVIVLDGIAPTCA